MFRNRKMLGVFISILTGGLFLVLFPPFRVVPLNEARNQGFDASAFAKSFLENEIPKALDRAINVSKLLPIIQENPSQARKAYGIEFGIGETYYYFVSGEGTVRSVADGRVDVSLPGDPEQIEIRIVTTNIFGNTIRNGTGLLNVSDFPNSRDFNAVSQELNNLVENHVLPSFRKLVQPGQTVFFVGCIEMKGDEETSFPITIVPIAVDLTIETV